MSRQGYLLNANEVARILKLLRETDLGLHEIAQRMMCTRGAIASINRRYRVRVYAGYRTRWTIAQDSSHKKEEAA